MGWQFPPLPLPFNPFLISPSLSLIFHLPSILLFYSLSPLLSLLCPSSPSSLSLPFPSPHCLPKPMKSSFSPSWFMLSNDASQAETLPKDPSQEQ